MRIAACVLALPLSLAVSWGQKEDWESTRSIAESQHEIVMLHIKKGEFKEAVAEASRIFYLPFPVDKHSLVVDEARQIADALIHYQQHALAQEVLDEALLAVSQPQHQALLLKEKGYLLKKMGREKEAMSCFKQAVELENLASAKQP